jgi:hypothetical protein
MKKIIIEGGDKYMVKKQKNNPNSILKSSASRILVGKKGVSSELRISGYSLSGLSSLKGVEYYENGCTLVAAVMVVVTLLAQLRCLKPDSNSSKMDQTPAFRFYKKRVLTDSTGKAAACIIASIKDEAVIHLPDDPDELSTYMIAVLDCYQGNERVLNKCTKDNLTEYISGNMSRIIGLTCSCPSSNIGTFGLNTDCVSWNVADVLSNIPCEDIKKLDPNSIKNLIREACGLIKDEEGNYSTIVFEEAPYTGPNSVEGGCSLEKDIFGTEMPSRTKGDKSTSKSKAKVDNIDLEAYKSVFAPLELRKLESAIKLNRIDLIAKYQALYEERKKDKNEDSGSSAEKPKRSNSPTGKSTALKPDS